MVFQTEPTTLGTTRSGGTRPAHGTNIRVMDVSPQLGIELLRGATRFLERDRQMGLNDWTAAGERLVPVGRGGQLAAAYFEVSPEVLSLVGLSEFQEWTGIRADSGEDSTRPRRWSSCVKAHNGLEKIPPLARLKALRLAHTLARRAPTSGRRGLQKLARCPACGCYPLLRDRLLDLALCVAGSRSTASGPAAQGHGPPDAWASRDGAGSLARAVPAGRAGRR